MRAGDYTSTGAALLFILKAGFNWRSQQKKGRCIFLLLSLR